jgi:plasmid stabilization system protein ParE
MLVRWTKPAVDDLTHICDYTEERFGAAQAGRAARAIYDAADTLNHMPGAGRTTEQHRPHTNAQPNREHERK